MGRNVRGGTVPESANKKTVRDAQATGGSSSFALNLRKNFFHIFYLVFKRHALKAYLVNVKYGTGSIKEPYDLEVFEGRPWDLLIVRKEQRLGAGRE